jgi:hypothetical protein
MQSFGIHLASSLPDGSLLARRDSSLLLVLVLT